MTVTPASHDRGAETALGGSFLSTFPPGSSIAQVRFVSEPPADQEALLRFPHPVRRWAVRVPVDPDRQGVAAGDLSVLAVPSGDREANGEATRESGGELLSRVRQWVDAAPGTDNPPSLVMTFQGAQLCWTPTRLAVLAHPDRLEAVVKALVEVAYYEAELRHVERTLVETWPQCEADMPLAFEFAESSIGRRKQLRQRFQDVLLLRARLARIGPYVHCPHLHPPTLASQVGERLRDRTRMVHRHESLGEQVEIFERVYEMCGQRSSDFMLTRSGNTLEWVIIVLLLTQILLYGFDLLTNMGP